MRKKLFTLLLAIVACIGTMYAWDYERVQIGDLYYNLDASTQTAEVTSQNSSYPYWSTAITTATIPASVTHNEITYSLTSIGESAFYGCSGLTSVTIPYSVTSIGEWAFWSCTGLTSVMIPNSVISIGSGAFQQIPNIVYNGTASGSPWGAKVVNGYIDDVLIYADASKTSLLACITSVQGEILIPNSVTSIGERAFLNCTGLTSVTIPNSVTSIGEDAFYGCTGLTSVTIGNSVTSIGDGAFYNCSNLTSVTIGNSVTSIGSSAFQNCSGLTSVTIPNSVTSIGSSAFRNCNSLTSVTIPNSVTSIRGYVFYNCSSLTSVHISDLTAWCAISFGDSSSNPLYYAHNLYLNETLVTDLIIPNDVTCIGDYALCGCSGLTSVTIPNSVTSIGNSAFSGCRGLTSVTIPNSVTSIGESAFRDCTGFESMTIPENILTIGNRPFAGCSGLKKVTWNAKKCVTYDDGQYVYPPFQECTNITSFTIGDEVEELPRGLCYGLPIASIIIPKSVKIIGVSAFRDCKNLNSVTIGDNVTTIGLSAFYDCKNLTSFTIGKSVNTINNYAFYGCSNLKTINVLPGTPPSITLNTFENISSNACFYVNFGKLQIYLTTDIWKQLNISLLENVTTTIIATATECSITFDIEDINIKSCGIEGGEQQAGNVLEYIGLEPNSEYKDVPIVLTSKEGLTETINVSFKTTALELTTKESKAVSSSTALLFAETNMSDAETNCGFEWKRENAPESMAGTKVYCPVASGQMAGRLKNLKDDVYYKYRAFYQSTAGNMYYGDWQYIFTGDVTVEFDPVLYTYTASAITETSAIISGYALAGSEDFTEQGFEYWAESRANNGANAPARKPAALGEHVFVKASGINMRVSLTDLDAGTVYKYRAYAKVGDQIYYGSEQSFTTSGTYTPPTYVITFVNWDGTELQSSPVAENTLPEYAGEQPTRPNDEEFSYSFKGWTPEIVIATEDATYTATFEKTTLTAISNIETGTSAQKVLRNGQIYILRGEKVYTLTGQAVK